MKGEWRKAGRGQGTFWSSRLSISGHMLALMSFKTASEILPNTPYVSPNLLTAYFNISTRHLIGSYWVSKLKHRNTIANDSHTFSSSTVQLRGSDKFNLLSNQEWKATHLKLYSLKSSFENKLYVLSTEINTYLFFLKHRNESSSQI